PPVLRCVATRNEGISEVFDGLEAHRAWLETTEPGRARQAERLLAELESMVHDALHRKVAKGLRGELAPFAERVARREIDPYAACEAIVAQLSAASGPP